MIRFLHGHVDFLALERFMTGEASVRESRRIARHLRDCDSCRARLEWLRELPEEIESATRPPLPEGMEQRILARRHAGERVILPGEERRRPAGPVRPLRTIGAAAVALAVIGLIGGLLFFRTRELGALWSELTFEPAAPGPGQWVEVTYRPDPELADEPWLVLRGRVTGPVDYATAAPRPERLTVLWPSGGTYRGAFTLRTGAVYAQLAVEDSAGAVVDDRGGLLWHLHVHRSGRPVSEALRAHAFLGPDWGDAHQALARAARLYPRDPRIQAELLAGELEFFNEAERDSALTAHRERFGNLARRFSEREQLTAEILVGLVEYARTLGDSSATQEWVTSLIERFPRHNEAIWYRVPPPPADRDDASLRRYLERLEALWRSAGPHPAIASPGFWTARQLADSLQTLRWAQREADNPGLAERQPGHVALSLAEMPALRGVAIERLRDTIRALDTPDDADRPLDRTAARHERERRDAMGLLLARLGELLLGEGQREAALDTLRRAASIRWIASVHRQVAELELASGDTLAAAMSLARANVPTFGGAALGAEEGRDSLRGAELVPADEWERMSRAAEDEMFRSILSASQSIELRLRPVYLFDSRGDRQTLQMLSHRTVTLVVFWEPTCGPAVRELPRLRRVTYLVRALGAEAIVITGAPPGESLSATLGEHEGVIPLYHDTDRRASAAFQQYGSPEYFVLGFDGRIRFADSDPDDVLAQVEALMNEPRLVTTAPTGRD